MINDVPTFHVERFWDLFFSDKRLLEAFSLDRCIILYLEKQFVLSVFCNQNLLQIVAH